jgi:hypothetical protein
MSHDSSLNRAEDNFHWIEPGSVFWQMTNRMRCAWSVRNSVRLAMDLRIPDFPFCPTSIDQFPLALRPIALILRCNECSNYLRQ